MKRFRILAATLLLIVLGTSAAFADVAPIRSVGRSGAIYVIVSVVVIVIAVVLLHRAVKKRRK